MLHCYKSNWPSLYVSPDPYTINVIGKIHNGLAYQNNCVSNLHNILIHCIYKLYTGSCFLVAPEM